MREVVLVRLREIGKVIYYDTNNIKLSTGDYCILEADRGQDFGQVVSEPEMILDTNLEQPIRRIIRVATRDDVAHIQRNKQRIKEAFEICEKKIGEHKLNMKLIDAEYAFDRSRMVFYFTAEGRIDFRGLVKDLAGIFKTRIELKQIGVRDEAKLLGGFGPCGRVLCCAKFLKDFEPVTIRMAKDQNLPLNPTKISGLCGRLMCCLGYEHSMYKQLLKGMPKEGERMKTEQGVGKVISTNPLKRTFIVEFEDGRQLEVKCKKDE